MTSGIQTNANALETLASTQAGQSNTLFGEANPAYSQALNFYQGAATGDPGKIATAISPAVQQINQATTSSIGNIMNNSPAGGEKNLAIENAKVAQGAQVGETATNAYLGSFNALGQLAGQGTSESTNAAGTGISGFEGATSAVSNIGNLQMQQYQIQQQAKGQTLGALASLGGDVAMAAAI